MYKRQDVILRFLSDFDTLVDLFSGSVIVGYMFKTQGKTVDVYKRQADTY